MYYEVFEDSVLAERVDYEYASFQEAAQGHPTYIVRKREDEECYRATSLQYNKQGTLWFATDQTWELEWNSWGGWWNCVNDEVLSITEFHGSGRSRYMTRQRDPEGADFILPRTTRWSDYDDDVIYGDYVVDENTGEITNTTAYLPGIAQMDTQTGNVLYFHSDQIGSLRAITTEYGEPIQRVVYTAFGEKVHEDGTIGTRYQYAGAWGYQTTNADDPMSNLGFLHVGHRYYDPSTGRFLQRDPIGIQAWPNVYVYVGNNPLLTIDPYGLLSWTGFKTGAAKGYLWITGGRRSWLDDPVKVKKVQRASRWVAKEAALTACGVGIASHLSKLRHLRWLNQNRYLRIGPGAHKGKRYHRIVIGREGGRVHWHIPVTRLRPFH